jgi:hypothetical protein
MGAPDLRIAIALGPECPHCGCDGFDDWWHARTVKSGCGIVSLRGSLRCHACGKFFAVTHYTDGETHSTAQVRQKAAQP